MRQGQVPNTHTQGIEQGIAEGGRHGGLHRLARPQRRLLRLVQHMDGQFGHLTETQDRVIGPALGRDARAVKLNRLFQGPAHALQGTAFGLVDHTVQVHHTAHIDGHIELQHTQCFACLHARQHSAPCRGVFVAGPGQPMALTLGFGLTPPGAAIDHGIQNGETSGVLHVQFAKLQRVLSAGMGQLVHEGLDGKHIGKRPQGPHGRGSNRHDRQPVVHHMGVVKRITWNGIAVRASPCGQRRVDGNRRGLPLCALRSPQQGGNQRATGPGAVTVGPQFVEPVADATLLVQTGPERDQVGTAQRRLRQLIRTRPHDPHRITKLGHGQQGCIKRHIVGTVVAITSGPLHVPHHDRLFVKPQGLGQVIAQILNALAVGPDLQGLAVPLGQCAAKTNRGVGNVRLEVLARQTHPVFVSVKDFPFLKGVSGFMRGIAQKVGQGMHVGQIGRLAPSHLRLQLSQCGVRLALRGGHDANKAPIHHQVNGRQGHGIQHIGRHGLIGISQLGRQRWRAQDPPMAHAWHAHIVDEPGLPHDLFGQVNATDFAVTVQLERLHRFGLGQTLVFLMQIDALEPIPIIPQRSPLGVGEAPLLDAQGVGGQTMVTGRLLKGQKTHFGTSVANGRSGVLN